MGCDYYIVKELYVLYKKCADGREKEGTIELDRQRCYFSECGDHLSCDSDDSDYYPRLRAFEEQYIAECMKVTYTPRILYENGQWKNKETEAKYSKQMKKEFGDSTIVSVVKREVRYLR